MRTQREIDLTTEVINWIKGVHGTDMEIQEDTLLLSNSLIDSMILLMMISHFEEKLNISIGNEPLVPENFETPEKIGKLYSELLEKSSK